MAFPFSSRPNPLHFNCIVFCWLFTFLPFLHLLIRFSVLVFLSISFFNNDINTIIKLKF